MKATRDHIIRNITETARVYLPLLIVSPHELAASPQPPSSPHPSPPQPPSSPQSSSPRPSPEWPSSSPQPPLSFALDLRMKTSPSSTIRKTLQQLITGDNPFLLLLDSFDDSLFEYITLCLFSRNYICIDEKPVLAFTDSPQNALIIRLRQQGWPEILQWEIPPYSWLTQPQQAADIAGALLQNGQIPDPIFIKGKDFGDTLSLEQQLHQHYQSLLDEHPALRIILTKQRQADHQLAALKKENRILQERLQNAQHTVSLIRTKYKDDYDTLFNWYQQEYEALPLWYRRFGQLIKVLTGKRTPKSLYRSFRRLLYRWTRRTAAGRQHWTRQTPANRQQWPRRTPTDRQQKTEKT